MGPCPVSGGSKPKIYCRAQRPERSGMLPAASAAMAGIPNKTSDRTQEPSLIMLCLPVVLWMCWHHSLTLDPLPGGGEGEEIIKARTDNASNFVEASAAGIAVD